MKAVLRGFAIGLCWETIGVCILAWMFYTGPLAGLSFLCMVGAALFIVVAPLVHIGIYQAKGSHRSAATITGLSMVAMLFALGLSGLFNFT